MSEERPTHIRFRTDIYQPDGDIFWTQMEPGDVAIARRGPVGSLYICCPNGKAEGESTYHLGSTAAHQHEWHADGVVTVSPSLLCGCGAHYFIRQNRLDYV